MTAELSGERRKLLTIIYDSGMESSMSELLDALEIPGITRIYDVMGTGGAGPKMNSAVFPGSNNLVMVSMPEEQVSRVQRAIRRLQGSYRLKPGITIFCQDVLELS